MSKAEVIQHPKFELNTAYGVVRLPAYEGRVVAIFTDSGSRKCLVMPLAEPDLFWEYPTKADAQRVLNIEPLRAGTEIKITV